MCVCMYLCSDISCYALRCRCLCGTLRQVTTRLNSQTLISPLRRSLTDKLEPDIHRLEMGFDNF